MADPSAAPTKIVVAGDIAIDWNLAHGDPARIGKTWASEPVSTLSIEIGGAALISHVLAAAFADDAGVEVAGPVAPERSRISPANPRLHHAHVQWSRQKGDGDPAWRAERFFGFRPSVPGAESTRPSSDGAVEDDDAGADIVVLSDAGLGFATRPDLWPQALDNEPLVLLRLATTSDSRHAWAASPLLDHLMDNHAARTVIIVGAAELRRGDVPLSAGVSWERTALDLLEASHYAAALQRFAGCAGIVVGMRASGAFVGRYCGSDGDGGPVGGHLVFDPNGVEGAFERTWPGEVVGYTTCLVAALAGALVRNDGAGSIDPEILVDGVRAGVQASRCLHLGGYELVAPGGRHQLRFPAEAIADELVGDPTAVDPRSSVGAVKTVAVPFEATARPDRWTILEQKYEGRTRRIARRIVESGLGQSLPNVPRLSFGALTTVDRREIEGYQAVEASIRRYCAKGSAKRPLSIAVFGPPGAGKSFGVKQIAKAIEVDLTPIEFNLSQMAGPEALIDALHQVRDIGIAGDTPLVFWDEFDTAFEGELGWLRYFLAPMWDGAFQDGQITHKVGRAIFVFAGGTAQRYAEFVTRPATVHDDREESPADRWRKAKGPDFVSRLAGYLDVAGPNELDYLGGADAFYRIRRAVILRSLLEVLYEDLFERGPKGELEALRADTGVVRALLGVGSYRHGARSIESLLTMSDLGGRTYFDRSALPPDGQLELHVSPRDLVAGLERWEPPELDDMARVTHELFCERLEAEGFEPGPVTDEDADPKTHSSLVAWDELAEDEQDENRDAVGYIPTQLRAIGCRVVRKTGGEGEIVAADFEPLIDRLAEAEHDRWLEMKLRDNWSWAPKETASKRDRTHKAMLPWEFTTVEELVDRWGEDYARALGHASLPEDERKKDADIVRAIPQVLDRHGYAIVRVGETE